MNIYGICDKLKSVNTKKGFVVSHTKACNDYIFNSKYYCHVGAMYRGYIDEGSAYVAPYDGRYGKGVVVALHSYYNGKASSRFMQIYFCIEKEGEEK